MQKPPVHAVRSKQRVLSTWLAISLSTAIVGVTLLARSVVEPASGLPVVECPTSSVSARDSDLFAIMVTGDGGWRAIDRDIASVLTGRGIPVAGLVSSDYFAERRTANESSAALERMIATYSHRWNRQRVILIGYSRGAGVLPFMISRLPSPERSRIAAVALLGLEPNIDFKTSPKVLLWDVDDDVFVPVRPELQRLRAEGLPSASTLCIAGSNDTGSICGSLPGDIANRFLLPGGHHFGGNYRVIADRILAEAHAAPSGTQLTSMQPGPGASRLQAQ